MKLSIVMPVYNEEKTLAEIVRRVLATPYEKELILVDDGSRDRSREIMSALARAPRDPLLVPREGTRAGPALCTGFRQTTGDAVLIGTPTSVRPTGLRHAAPTADRGQGRRRVRQPLPGQLYARVHLFWHYVGVP
jgi:cellulose synthase/poly-beta-1,6-N-acetylglucosamine synthase-like glycosyltransferase